MKQGKSTSNNDYAKLLKKDGMLPTYMSEDYEIIKGSFKNIIEDVLEAKLESEVMALYAMGTSTRDAIVIIKELYGCNMKLSYISKITNKLWPKIEEFKTRRLDKIYSIILLDGIRFKTREDEVSKEVSI